MAVFFTSCESADKKSTETTVGSKTEITTAPAPVKKTLDTTAVDRPLLPGK